VAPFSELSGSRDLLLNLTLRELRGKYKRSALGWFWSLLNPLATMLIFTVVFQYFLRIDVPPGDPSRLDNFAFFLVVGLLPWNFLSLAINGAMVSLTGNSNLIKKVYFPREALVTANVASWFVSFLIEMAVLAVALVIVGNFVLPWLVPVLLIAVVQTAFVLGIGLVLSAVNVYFRDVQHLLGIFLQFWFYATPVIYPLDVVPKTARLLGQVIPLRTLYGLNPMVQFVEAYRDCMYDLRLPSLGRTAYLVAVAVVTLAAGMAVFARLEPKLAEEL
jgi:ABC-type polysaccharide/polyol phosphate export permease